MIQVLQRKHQNSKKLASLSIQNEKRANELEQIVDHMKYQKVQLQKTLRRKLKKGSNWMQKLSRINKKSK